MRSLAAAILAIALVVVGLVGVSPASSDPVNPYNVKTVRVPSPTAVAITADSSTVVVGSTNSKLYFIDSASHTITTTLNVSHAITDLKISPDGTKVYLVSDADDLVQVVDMNTRTVTEVIALTGYSPNSITITPDGTRGYLTESTYITTGVYPDEDWITRVIVIDFANGDAISTIERNNSQGHGTDIAITPDGKTGFVAVTNGNLNVIDTDPASPDFNTIVDHEALGSARHMVISHDGSKLWSVDNEGVIYWCDLPTDYCPDDLTMYSYGTPNVLALSPDGEFLYSGNREGDFEIFDLTNKESIDRYDNSEEDVVGIAASADGVFVVTANFYDNKVAFFGGVTTPDEPYRLRVTSGDGSLSVAFRDGYDGGSPITKYQYKLGTGAWTDAVETSSPITITGLTNYTNYAVRLRAVNAVGAGRQSGIVRARPRNTGPVISVAAPVDSTSIRVDYFGVLFSDVTQAKYIATAYEAGTTYAVGSCQTKKAGRFCTISGLSPDTEYDVTVTNYFRFFGDPVLRRTLPSAKSTVRTPA